MPVAQLDRASDYGSEGSDSNSGRRATKEPLQDQACGVLLLPMKFIKMSEKTTHTNQSFIDFSQSARYHANR